MVYVCEQDPPVYQSYTRLYCVCTAHKRQTGRDKGSLHVYISSSSTVYHELDIAVHSLYLHYLQSSPVQSSSIRDLAPATGIGRNTQLSLSPSPLKMPNDLYCHAPFFRSLISSSCLYAHYQAYQAGCVYKSAMPQKKSSYV